MKSVKFMKTFKMNVRRKPGERWDKFPNAEGYLISSHGRVYSELSKRILALEKNNKGYSRIKIRDKYHFIHIKVVEVFGDCMGIKIPTQFDSLIKNGLSIDHLDRNKDNNKSNNLELVTHQENCIRRSRKEIIGR